MVRRAAGIMVMLLLGTVACSAGLTPAGGAPGQQVAGDKVPPAATAGTVQAGLGVKNVAEELVFLVDMSESMGPDGDDLYANVQQALPSYIAELAHTAPQDQVAVITFGHVNSAQVVDPLGPPSPDYVLPGYTDDGSTDFGDAFRMALGLFSPLPKGIKAGGVVLLSDGGNDSYGDPQYATYQSYGWELRRQQLAGLPIPVTGYALPLTTNKDDISGQLQALGAVFGANVETMPNGTANLSSALRASGQAILDAGVANAARPDSGQGVRVSWSGLPARPFSIGSGPLDVAVTLTAPTAKVPLDVTGLRLVPSGLPVTVSRPPPSAITLRPGQHVTLPVQLSLRPGAAGTSHGGSGITFSGRLALTGTVGSSYLPALRSAFDDTSFSVGGLHGATSGQFPLTTATTDVLRPIITVIVIVLVIALAALLVLAFATGLRGTLVLTPVKGAKGELRLGPFLWRSASTSSLINLPGRIKVRKWPFSRTMHVRLDLTGLDCHEDDLVPGGRTLLVGIDVLHRASRDVAPEPNPAWHR